MTKKLEDYELMPESEGSEKIKLSGQSGEIGGKSK